MSLGDATVALWCSPLGKCSSCDFFLSQQDEVTGFGHHLRLFLRSW
jgi:hypothetical protein